MTVPKTTGLTPRAQPTAETESAAPKGGEFEAVLEEKNVTRPARKMGGRPGSVGGEGATRPADQGGARGRPEGRVSGGRGHGPAGATGAGSPPTEARDAAAEHALRDTEGERTFSTATREDADAPAADLVRPAHTRWAPAAPAVTDATPAADATARIERIAEQILQAAEVRLHADGGVEARLQLDLGRLGRMHVALERTAEGQIRVSLEPTTTEARDLLQAHGKELANRLEARGLKLQALTVESSGETVLRLEGTGRETTETVATRPAAPPSEPAPAEPAATPEAPPQKDRFDEEHERRDRRERDEVEPSGEEEEER